MFVLKSKYDKDMEKLRQDKDKQIEFYQKNIWMLINQFVPKDLILDLNDYEKFSTCIIYNIGDIKTYLEKQDELKVLANNMKEALKYF